MRCAGSDCKRDGTQWFVFQNVCVRVCAHCAAKMANELAEFQRETDE